MTARYSDLLGWSAIGRESNSEPGALYLVDIERDRQTAIGAL